MILTDPVDQQSTNYDPRLNFILPANDESNMSINIVDLKYSNKIHTYLVEHNNVLNSVSGNKPRTFRPSSGQRYTKYEKTVYLFFWGGGHKSPQWAMAPSFTMFLNHTQQLPTVCRTPLDSWDRLHTVYIIFKQYGVPFTSMSEESYQQWRVWVCLWSPDNKGALADGGLLHHGGVLHELELENQISTKLLAVQLIKSVIANI
jgi:hypothetical protein